mmetsp:Transcript_75441/g.214583  ORF Transcript_75441/g.214583 Transcript_75441/m.214583 type:complete len:408 (-) Transcript_75441:185-1408(-)|eukprot:CAMPEP_0119543366 /NCGR_PEP_ID=MMETSP1344-20130328/54077_1 /TAXON_ID=236787 /ORGANISM="Florenciella parvula, Strain CCMP2471" /LENGTH=407 /DNA_ID=CAMNT_0007587647 /DNA_START=162 /DNA_END=1385 /DNA_ORIENTATION=+
MITTRGILFLLAWLAALVGTRGSGTDRVSSNRTQASRWGANATTAAFSEQGIRALGHHKHAGNPGDRRIISLAAAKRHREIVDAGTCLLDAKSKSTVHCFPSLICIGAMKAGTFELKSWCDEHEMFLSAKKEVHFFGFGRSEKEWMEYVFDPLTVNEWTMSLKDAKAGTITMEKTPYYISSAEAALEMRSLLPSVKLVAMLREPAARAYSSFYHHCSRNHRLLEYKNTVVFNAECSRPEMCCCGPLDNPPLGNAKEAECTPETFHQYLLTTVSDPHNPGLGTVLRKGLYAQQLKMYIDLFSKEQVYVIDTAVFTKYPQDVMAQFFAWLGLPPHDFKDAYKNELGYWVASKKALSKSLKKLDKHGEEKKRYTYRPMLNESKEWLSAFHEKPNEDLAALFPEMTFSWMD